MRREDDLMGEDAVIAPEDFRRVLAHFPTSVRYPSSRFSDR